MTDEGTSGKLEDVLTKDLVDELLKRERVTSISVPHGKKFPDISRDEWNIRTGPAKIIIIYTFNRKDGYE